MKNILRKITILSMAALCLPFVACNDDDDPTSDSNGNVSSLTHIDLYTPESTENMEYKGDGIFLTDVNEEITLFPVKVSNPVSEDVTLTVKIRRLAVEKYNVYHDTQFTHIDDLEILNPELTILKGQSQSTEPIKVRFGNIREFQDASPRHMIALALDSIPEGFAGGDCSEILVNFNRVFPPNPIELETRLNEFGLIYVDGAFINLASEKLIKNAIVADHAVEDNIKVVLEIDPSKVSEFNESSDVQYEMFPNVQLKETEITIEQGKATTDFTLQFTDKMATVENGKSYVIPVVIKEVSGAAAEIGTEKVTYVRFNTNATVQFTLGDEPLGNHIVDYDSWTVTVDGSSQSYYGDPWFNILNGSVVDFVYPNSVLLVDMQSPRAISSFKLKLGGWGSLTNIKIATSLDGVDFDEVALTFDGLQEAYFVVPVPVTTRYIRLVSSSYYSPSNLDFYGPAK